MTGGTPYATDNNEGHNNEDKVDTKNSGVAAEDMENVGVVSEECLDKGEVFLDAAEDVLVDEGFIDNNEPGLLEIADEETPEENEVILNEVHVDEVDEVESPEFPNTNNNVAETANDGNAPTQNNVAEIATDGDAPTQSRLGRPIRRPRFRDPAEGYQFFTIGDNNNTVTITKYAFVAKVIAKEES